VDQMMYMFGAQIVSIIHLPLERKRHREYLQTLLNHG